MQVKFCLDFHRETGPWPAPAPTGGSPAPSGNPLLLVVAPRPAARNAQPGQRAGVTGPAPVHDMAGVQALPAKHRAPLAIECGVVKPPTPPACSLAVNVRRRARSGTSGSGRLIPAPATRPRCAIPGARSSAVVIVVISARISIHTLRSLIVRGPVPQLRLTERVVP